MDSQSFPGEPSLLYSTRTFWYPQGTSGDYATAVMHLSVPEMYQVVASGELAPGSPVVVPGHDRQSSGRRYNFEAKQPVRYLACVISRFVRVSARTLSLVEPLSVLASAGSGAMPAEPLPAGSFNSQLELIVESNPRQVARARQAGEVAAGVAAYYTSIYGDSPYPDLTLALIEKDLPGGHSPAYLAVLYQPLPTASSNWSNDPAAFISFPEYLIAHETAHQWWGQAVGWRTYHDQWISEGFSVLRRALCPPAPGRRTVRRDAPAHGEIGPASKARRARCRSATASGTSRATAASSGRLSTTRPRSCCTCSGA